ncbi:hypothetical protein EDM52_18915 [Brevibacillus invocatus]|uniref:BIG2 domain-containing protein n=1 Tax=Brevibacillus invocatus TaxID=173959 RepID=A0A3M8C1L0_9BACL|nr:Ig-like domain-containing protein [Brevibacillus invocatus]RNB69544.1 hypothetical protein EDM52_18915 [Brevibacillus invocatus]
MFWKKTMLLFLAVLLLGGFGTNQVGLAADEVSKLVLTTNKVTLETGDTHQLTANAVYQSGKVVDVTLHTTWTSADSTIAAVYAGKISGNGVGNSTITASYLSFSAVVDVNVTKKVKALTSQTQSVNSRIGQEDQVQLTAVYSDSTEEDVTAKADWTVDKGAIATVLNGKVKGLSSGTANVTAKYGSQTFSFPISVEIAHRLESSKSKVSLLLNEEEQVSLKAIFPDGSENPNVEDRAEWSTSNAEVADVIKGKIKAYDAGTAVITASYGTKTATIQVDVDMAQKLELNKQDLFLKVGATADVVLTATYANGDSLDVKDKAAWTSSKESVAYYSNGQIHAVSSGEAVITASYGNKTVQMKVDVEVPRSLDIVPAFLVMKSGSKEDVIVKASFANGTKEEITDKVEWSSDNEEAVFAKDGTISAYKPGTANVKATYGGKTATLVVDVDVPQNLVANVTNLAMQIGEAKQITVKASFPNNSGESEDVTNKLTWTSTSPAVATVRQGLVTGVGTGATTITATLGTRTLTIPVSVGVMQTLTVDKKKLVLAKDDSETVRVTASYGDGTTKDVTEQAAWSSSSAAVAEVHQGKITAVGTGVTTISATFDGKTVTVTVEVGQAQSLAIDPRLLILTVGESADLALTATDSAGDSRKVSADAEWSSSNVKIADVAQGRVTGLTSGRVTITAKYGGKSISIPVEVGIVTKLEADKRFVTLKSKNTAQVSLIATLSDGRTMDVTSAAEWRTSNYKAADVSKGLISGIAFGKSTVTARYSGKTVSIPVDVDTLKYLKTDVVQIVMSKGEVKQVTATATYMDGSEQNVTKPALWTTNRLLVADVKDGVIKATGSGKATIYVQYGGKKTPIVVTVR